MLFSSTAEQSQSVDSIKLLGFRKTNHEYVCTVLSLPPTTKQVFENCTMRVSVSELQFCSNTKTIVLPGLLLSFKRRLWFFIQRIRYGVAMIHRSICCLRFQHWYLTSVKSNQPDPRYPAKLSVSSDTTYSSYCQLLLVRI